MYPKEFS